MSQAKTVSELLVRYRQTADRADVLSDPKEQNKAADQLHACYKKLRESEEGRNGLIALMEDSSPHVRCWAAAHSLQWVPERARRILEALRDEDVFPYSFDAKMTLEEFEKGSLTFDQ